jgi:WD40 repeat protein
MIGKYIYLACEDGTIKILKIKKTRIELVRTLVRVDQKCLSLDLVQPADKKTLAPAIYAGYSDSSIRKWDLLSGNSVLHFAK